MGNRARQASRKRDPPSLEEFRKENKALSAGNRNKALKKVKKSCKQINHNNHGKTQKIRKRSNSSKDENVENNYLSESDEVEEMPLDEYSQDEEEQPLENENSVLDEQEQANLFSDSDGEKSQDDEASLQKTDFEKEAEENEIKRREDNLLAQKELMDNIKESEPLVLPSGEEIQMPTEQDVDIAKVHQRISEIIRTLSNFSELRDPTRSRSEYLDQLIKDISTCISS